MESPFLSPPTKRSRLFSAAEMPDPTPSSVNGSSKRPPPPLNVPPGQVALRLLCHASRIGGVIGKSGSIIKQLQQSTGAKIRVEEAPIECSDRVVTVIAPAALVAKIQFHQKDCGNDCSNGDSDCEESEGVSKAQEGLVRVFERILVVAAETDVGAGVAAGGGVVSCRMLAETSQVGSVIGKGGKVVEKIRKDCGCKIRVLTDKLPPCAGPSDQIIEIEGDVLAVKKALVAVSRRLQDCPPVDKTRMIRSRPHEVVPSETLPDLHVDVLAQQNLVLPTMPSNSVRYTSGVRPLSIEADRLPTTDTRPLQMEVTFRILCSNDRAGGVIGKGGTIVKALQNETGASISVGSSVADCDERLITITASEDPESRHSPAQRALALVFSRSIEVGIEKGLDLGTKSSVTARIVVSSNQVGCLMGKGGTIISEMRKVTSTGIRILGVDLVPKCATENDEVVQISGELSNVKDALYYVSGRLRDNLFTGTNGAGTRSISSVVTETSPYGRLRDAGSLELQPSVGLSRSRNQHTALTHSMDHLGLSHSLDRHSPPRSWGSQLQTVGGLNPRSITDGSRGVTSRRGGLALGSGSKSAFVTNTTVEIVVPANSIGSVYGENGTNLSRLRQISGAKVIVHEPRSGRSESIVVISGTPDETQVAQSLLQAFILTGS